MITQDWDDGFAANAALQVRYLADRGHTHIATALPDNENPLGELRVRWRRSILTGARSTCRGRTPRP